MEFVCMYCNVLVSFGVPSAAILQLDAVEILTEYVCMQRTAGFCIHPQWRASNAMCRFFCSGL